MVNLVRDIAPDVQGLPKKKRWSPQTQTPPGPPEMATGDQIQPTASVQAVRIRVNDYTYSARSGDRCTVRDRACSPEHLAGSARRLVNLHRFNGNVRAHGRRRHRSISHLEQMQSPKVESTRMRFSCIESVDSP